MKQTRRHTQGRFGLALMTQESGLFSKVTSAPSHRLRVVLLVKGRLCKIALLCISRCLILYIFIFCYYLFAIFCHTEKMDAWMDSGRHMIWPPGQQSTLSTQNDENLMYSLLRCHSNRRVSFLDRQTYKCHFLCIKAPGFDVFFLEFKRFRPTDSLHPLFQPFHPPVFSFLFFWHPLSVCRHYPLSAAIIPKAIARLVLKQWQQSVARTPTFSFVHAPFTPLVYI